MTSAGGPAGEVTVELFGVARLATGRRAVRLPLPEGATLRNVLAALAEACPGLAGRALADGGTGLLPGWVLNVNGASFVDRLDAKLAPGDSVLLLSDQAGG